MKGFLDNFYNVDTLRGTLVSDQACQASWNLAVTASATAAVACIGTWTTDFRDDLPKIDVPMLVVHGDADQVLPLDKTGKRLPGLINDVAVRRDRGRPARHPLDPRRPGQHRAAGLLAQLNPGHRNHHLHDSPTEGVTMSNHFSAANLKSPGDDARLDLTDLFVFAAPDDPDRTVLIMDANPFTKGDGFHPDAVYRFNIDTDGDALADVAFSFTFSEPDNGRQTATAYYATGSDAQTREPRGDMLIEATPVGFDATATPVQAGPCRLFIGKRSDPFFADAEGVLHWLVDGQPGDFQWTGTDTFAGANIFSIAVEVPNDMLGPGPIGAWITDQPAPRRHAGADGPRKATRRSTRSSTPTTSKTSSTPPTRSTTSRTTCSRCRKCCNGMATHPTKPRLRPAPCCPTSFTTTAPGPPTTPTAGS